MSVGPWNISQLCRPNIRYGDQEHFYWNTEAGQTIPAGCVFTTSLSSRASTSASCGRRRLSLKTWRPQRTYLLNRTTKNYGPRLVDETALRPVSFERAFDEADSLLSVVRVARGNSVRHSCRDSVYPSRNN